MVHPVHPVHPTMIHHGYHWAPDGTSTAVDHTTSLVLRTFALRSLAKRRFGVHSVHIGDWSHPMTPPLTILTSCGDQVRSSGKWQLIISPAINSLGLTQGLTPPKLFLYHHIPPKNFKSPFSRMTKCPISVPARPLITGLPPCQGETSQQLACTPGGVQAFYHSWAGGVSGGSPHGDYVSLYLDLYHFMLLYVTLNRDWIGCCQRWVCMQPYNSAQWLHCESRDQLRAATWNVPSWSLVRWHSYPHPTHRKGFPDAGRMPQLSLRLCAQKRFQIGGNNMIKYYQQKLEGDHLLNRIKRHVDSCRYVWNNSGCPNSRKTSGFSCSAVLAP